MEYVAGNAVAEHEFENFEKIDPNRGLLIVANHRTFYDQFIIAARLFSLYGPHHNIYFPVRSNYFYDNPMGLLINMALAMSAMYPPIVRDRRRLRWNSVATDIMVDLLKNPANMVGFHPEGTRNRGPDPYKLLPAKPGAGEIIYRANPNVLPVFVQGFPDSFRELFRDSRKKRAPADRTVHMVMGEPIDFSTERQLEPSRKTYLQISKRLMDAIEALSRKERDIRRLQAQATGGQRATRETSER